MKGNITMNNKEMNTGNSPRSYTELHGEVRMSYQDSVVLRGKKFFFSFLILALLAGLLSCESPFEQPFRAGLGPVVDTQAPTVNLINPAVSTYIFGTQTFTGVAQDDYSLESVWLAVSNYPDLDITGDFMGGTTKDPQKGYLVWVAPSKGIPSASWACKIDTIESKIPDGDLKIRLTVVESSGKHFPVTTDEYVFKVKNNPPAITVAAPPIQRGNIDDGDVGSVHLNYDAELNVLPPSGTKYQRQMEKLSSLKGSVIDDEGIYLGDENPARNLYPPQIRFWRVRGENEAFNPADPAWLPGAPPSLEEVPWRSFTEDELTKGQINIQTAQYTNCQFKYNLPPETNRFYGFEVRARNTNTVNPLEFHYPRDFYPETTNWNDAENILNSYVMFYLSVPQEPPLVNLWGLEDLAQYWQSGGASSPTLTDAQGELNNNRAHPYINDLTAIKNGPFILRIRASHTESIAAAEVYWRRDGTTERGRFIWDPAESSPPGVSNWDSSNSVRRSVQYNMWGYRDFYTKDRVTRTFIFNYRHNGFRIPGTSDVHAAVRGRNQVQWYINEGVNENADLLWSQKNDGSFAIDTSNRWTDYDPANSSKNTLEDGIYLLEVFARTESGSISEPFTCTIRLDTVQPDVNVNDVLVTDAGGKYERKIVVSDGKDYGEYTVNGVIQPTLSPETDIRIATEGNYFNLGAANGYEQFFILVQDGAQKNALQQKITKYWWPITASTTPTGAAASDIIGGLTVKRHDRISSNAFKIKTSDLYDSSPAEPEALADGAYWLYVFRRDNAFNVGWTAIKLNVRKADDIPVLVWSSDTVQKVTNPNQSADNTDAGFVGTDGAVRNKLTLGSLKLHIKDDDSLDLGIEGGANSNITINFTGSEDAGGVIKPLTDRDPAFNITLSDAQMKQVFRPQSVSGSGRERAEERKGEISQKMLVDALKANVKYNLSAYEGTRPPDGMYYFTITVKDDPSLKMKMANSDTNPAVKDTTESFWIVVDSKLPQYEISADSAQPNEFISNKPIKGTVSDENGPVTITALRTSEGPEAERNKIDFGPAQLNRDTAVTDKWIGSFEAPVNMNGATGRFQFEIEFADRFGNINILRQYLQVDGTPPEAVIGTKLSTFERNYPDVKDGGTDIGETNRKRLANGVLNFNISARDNIAVTEVKWWLVSGENPVPPAKINFSDVFYSNSASGWLTSNFSAMQYVDTAGMNGAYTLFVMAKDSAGNVSDVTANENSRQTVYLLQEQDRPYFYPDTTGGGKLIIPDNGTVVGNAMVTGEITDDDGFFDNANPTPNVIPGSVRIWMKNGAPSGAVNLEDEASFAGNGFTTAPAVYGSGSFTGGLIRARKGVMSMAVDLTNLFGSLLSTDGLKYYIVEARDSYYDKYKFIDAFNGEKPSDSSDRVWRRKMFSFIYDTQPPAISLSYPDPADKLKTFGPNANDNSASSVNFHITGKISDANLKKTDDNYYYFDYRLDSDDKKTFKLEPSPDITVTPNGDGTVVDFTISADRFCAELDFMTAVASDINHTLTLYAYDKSGKDNSCSFNFVKDTNAPTLTFTNLNDKIRLPKVNAQDWWRDVSALSAADQQAWYKVRHEALDSLGELSVITYEKGNTQPQLKVIFDDVTSFINTAALKVYIDGETVSRASGTYTATPGVSNTARSVSCTINLVQVDTTGSPLSGSPSLLDGVHSIRLEIEDAVGNKLAASDSDGSIYWGFRINSGLPEITGDMPGTPAGSRNVWGNITATPFFSIAKVTAKGPNLKDAKLTIKAPSASWGSENNMTSPSPVWSFEPSTNNEVLTWNTYGITTAMLSNAAEGEYQLELLARGRDTDQKSAPYVWNFTVDKSSPTLIIRDFPDGAKIATGTAVNPNYASWVSAPTNRKVFNSPSQGIQGLISDKYSDLKSAQILIQRYDYSTGSWGNYYTRATETTGNWTATTEVWNELLVSTDKLRDKVVDVKLGNIQGIDNGLYRVRLRARDSAYVNGDTAWTGTVDGNPIADSSYYYFFYAPGNPAITFSDDADPKTLYSAKVSNGTLRFAGTATRPATTVQNGNGYQKLEVKIERSGSPDSTMRVDGLTSAPWNGTAGTWNWAANLTFLTTSVGDGTYKLTFTVTDWAGNTASKSRSITVDNTPPSGVFTAPELMPAAETGKDARYANGSETFYGGENSVIQGNADDTNGLAGIWYHLGYVASAASATDMLTLPTKQDVIRTITQLASATDDLGGDTNNGYFDAAASATGATSRAWFKYDPAATQQPLYFKLLNTADNSNLFNWKLEIPFNADGNGHSLSLDYARPITLKNRNYNAASGLRLAQKLNEATGNNPLSPAYRKSDGLYCMPVWVRVADKAGNVTYFNQNIWLYPNGDYPTNAITSPSERTGADQSKPTHAGTQAASRGGTVLFDGIASDNVNVRSVIYRIRADNRKQGDSGWADTGTSPVVPAVAPPITQFITPAGAQEIVSGQPEYTTFNDTAKNPDINTSHWFRATLEGADSTAKSKSWSFYLNSGNEFTNKDSGGQSPIDKWGFKSSATLAANDMIRVYVEILVFDDNYRLMSLGESNATTNAKPDVVIFYLSETSPRIETLRLSNVGTIARNATAVPTAADSYSPYSISTRSENFAIQMAFNSGSSQKTISKVQVRLPSEAGSGGNIDLAQWKTAWSNKADDDGAAGNKKLPGITFNPASPSVTTADKFTMFYGFNTLSDITRAGFAPVMRGSWATSGGKYIIEVRLSDNSDPPRVTDQTFEVGIDNFAPVADETNVISNTKVAGTNQNFMGRVYDYYGLNANPSPGYFSIDRVYAWFTKAANGTSQYVDMTNANISATVPTVSIPAWQGRKASGLNVDTVTDITLTNPGTGNAPVSSAYPQPSPGGVNITMSTNFVKVISEAQAAIQANNMNWQPITAGRSVLWSFIADTTKLPDGPIYLNYIVVDSAGNASRYQQSMVVMNKYPIITDLTLYTDNTGEGAVFTTHEGIEASSDYKVPDSMSAGYLNTGFISKNKYIGFKVKTAGGNGNLHYRVQYVKRYEEPLTLENLQRMAGKNWPATNARATPLNLYTIASKGTMDDNVWAGLMGRPKVTAVPGMHFVFRATAADIAGMNQYGTGANAAKVYRYERLESLFREKTPAGESPPRDNFVVDDGNYSSSDPGFRFTGNTAFGTDAATQITELNGSHPDVGDTTTDNPAATAFFLIKVYDSVAPSPATEDEQLYEALVVGMNVYLTDGIAPNARLYDLNPYTEMAVTGNNITPDNLTATINNAADPTAIGSNIIRGGLYNINTEREPVKSGYIDPRNSSWALSPKNSSWANNKQTGATVPDSDYPLKVSGDSNALTGVTNPARDKVSGKVILRGIAWDNQLIDQIQINIGGSNNKTILEWDTATQKMKAAGTNKAYAVETLHWKTGHTVEWAYIWDTEAEPGGRTGGGPSADVSVQVTVRDRQTTPLSSLSVNVTADTANNAPFHNLINVDIVPYITGFQRETPKFTTKRSLQGWYSFYQGEANIAVLGYNLGTAPANVAVSMSSGTGGSTTTNMTNVAYNTAATYPANTLNRFSFTVPAAAVSGRLNVTVNSIAAYNHSSSHADKSWNREYSSYTPGSDLWINKPYAHIWRTTQQDGAPRTYIGSTVSGTTNSSTGLDHPGMALEYVTGGAPGTLHATWAVYANANSYYGTNTGTSNYIGGAATPNEPYSTPDISILNGGAAGSANIGFNYQQDGQPALRVKSDVTNTGTGSEIQAATNPSPTQRWQNVRISKAAANGTGTDNVGRIHMTAFDSFNKGLWYGTRATGNNTMFIDGGNVTAGVVAGTTGITASTNAGQYSAVDYDTTGPIIAYYDQQHDTVRIALGASAAPTAANNWTRYYLLRDTNKLYRGSGKYISIKVDRDNGIHLAFYNSVYNKMVYFYASGRAQIAAATPPNPGTSATDNVRLFTVDDVLTSGGIWTDISVHDTGGAGTKYPWIVYGDNSRTGNYDGVRVAYLSGGTGTGAANNITFSGELKCPVTGADIKGWEALTMPANYLVGNDRLNIEAWPPTIRGGGTLGASPGWNAAIGYASDMFRVGYFYYPTWKGYGSNTQNAP